MDIAAYRDSQGLTQEQAANALGLQSKGYFSLLERGIEPISIRLALQIQVWSGGQVRAAELVSAEDRALMEAAAAAAEPVAA